VRHLAAAVALMVLPVVVAAAEPVPKLTATINRGLAYLARDNATWRETRKCAECHHAPFTVWALNEGKKRGYAVDEKALAELSAWALAKDIPAKPAPTAAKPEPIEVNEAPLLLALGVEAGDAAGTQDGLKKLLTPVLRDQNPDGSWRLSLEFRPIGSSPEVLTTLALLALSAPNAPDLGPDAKAARDKGLKWLRAAHADDEPQAAALRLVLWRRLGRPAAEWEPWVKKIRDGQNADGGWGQTAGAKSDAYATGQMLYALAEAGATPGDPAVRSGQTFLAKTQREHGGWVMVSRAVMRDGKPPKNLAPITHAGSAWAVLGLVRSAASGKK
jgi:squalene-hopene/tetraprenyl-beta-curcumene cyclase